MPVTLATRQYPDDFQIVTCTINHNLEAPTLLTIPVFYVESRGTGTGIVIDSIVIGINVVEGAAETVEVVHATSIEASSGLTSIQTATTSVNSLGTTLPTINTANNFVPAGSWVLLKFDAAQAAVHGAVQIRFRSRVA